MKIRTAPQLRLTTAQAALSLGTCAFFLPGVALGQEQSEEEEAHELESIVIEGKRADETESAATWLTEFSRKWDESAWTGGRRAYIRALDDDNWKVRMNTLVKLSKAGPSAQNELLKLHLSLKR